MIVDKIYNFLENEKELGSEEAVEKFLKEAEYGFKRQFLEERVNRKTLRLSSIGKCMRQQWFTAKGYPAEPVSPRASIIFWQGDLIEACTNALAKMAKVDIRREQEEVELEGIKGHIDGVLYENDEPKAVVEIKSMADYSFKRFEKEGIDNTFGYTSQGIAYATALDLNSVVWVATNKNTGAMAEYLFTVTDEMKRDIVKRVQELKKLVNSWVMPFREYYPEKDGKLPVQCQYCGHKHNCYKELDTVIKNGKPQFFAKVA